MKKRDWKKTKETHRWRQVKIQREKAFDAVEKVRESDPGVQCHVMKKSENLSPESAVRSSAEKRPMILFKSPGCVEWDMAESDEKVLEVLLFRVHCNSWWEMARKNWKVRESFSRYHFDSKWNITRKSESIVTVDMRRLRGKIRKFENPLRDYLAISSEKQRENPRLDYKKGNAKSSFGLWDIPLTTYGERVN